MADPSSRFRYLTRSGRPKNEMAQVILFGRGPGVRLQRRRRRRAVEVLLVFLLIVLAVPSWFLFPPQVTPISSDAVVVLAGASDGRHQLAAQLVEYGISDNLVVSNPRSTEDRVGSAHCRGKDRPEEAVGIWCVKPEPVTTAGEALTVGQLAAREEWLSLTVVTNRPHTRRAQTIFEKCTNLDITVTPIERVDRSRMPYQVAREIAGYLKFWITNPCGDQVVSTALVG